MRTLLRRTTVLWTREEGPTLVLVFLLALLFVVPFLEEWFPVVAPASTGFFILLLVAGVRAVSRSLWAALVVSLLAGTAIAFEVVRQLGGGDSLAGWRTGAGCLTVGLFAAVTLFRVFAPGPITGHRLVGAVAVYLLAGLTWAFAYEWLSVMRPGSFRLDAMPGDINYRPLLYFSFVTLSTVGYGDITPVSPAARALANMESLLGVLYPAVLIGRLLSLQGSTRPGLPDASGEVVEKEP